MKVAPRCAAFFALQGGIQTCGCDTVGSQAVDLVLHEGDQRRDDDRETLSDKCGELEAEGLSTAGRQQCEDIAAGEGIPDDLFLQGAKRRIAEVPFEG